MNVNNRSNTLLAALSVFVVAAGGACTTGSSKTPFVGPSGTAGSSGGGSAGESGSAGSGSAGASAGANGDAGQSGGSAGASASAGANGSAGQSGGSAGSGSAGAATNPDGGGSAGAAPVDAAIVDGGAMGVVAPGLGADTPSPAKPTIGLYGKTAQRDIQFTAASLDPNATIGHQGENQHGRFDSSKPTKWKLIVLLPGIGGGPGLGTSGWIASQGFHEFDVAYDSGIPGAPDKPDPRASDPATVGNTRMNQFDGKGRTPACGDDNCSANAPTVTRSNSIEERVTRGIKHLAEVDPDGGWDWYLNADGTVRWSDCGFFGYSYGATHAAVISVYVRLGLIVVGSGPWNEGHPEATWIKTQSATPGIRAYAIYGKMDGRYPDYENETKELGWPGPYPFELSTFTQGDLTAPAPWYMGSHSLLVDTQGHTEFCAGSNTVCLYSFDHDGQ
ncbi:MAG TPA: hypothetical protein VK989_05585 [Polyangia bacterium]|jgi:hypothetical protein|nr:hypothetical protein [Polyangia bacterium]